MKACLINTKNQEALATQFNIEKNDMLAQLPLGYFVVADFGSDAIQGVMSLDNFNAKFTILGKLQGDWVEILAK